MLCPIAGLALALLVACDGGAGPRGLFSTTGSMTTARQSHTATLLLSGKVLIVGGMGETEALSSAELYDPASGTFTPTGSMTAARVGHTATLLPEGKVLVAGGDDFSGGIPVPLSSAELYDPTSGSFTAAGAMTLARESHTATLLQDGKVLIAGGSDRDYPMTPVLASTELYDPASGTFTLAGSMGVARVEHTATLLLNGKVLIAGGVAGFDTFSSAELYDPASGTFTPTGTMTAAREWHKATLLPGGKVLIAGGVGGDDAIAQLYDPASGTFTPTGTMIEARFDHTATLLHSGKVLIAGGGETETLSSAELYDLASEAFKATGSMASARFNHTATLLPNGKVLVAGGSVSYDVLSSAELYY